MDPKDRFMFGFIGFDEKTPAERSNDEGEDRPVATTETDQGEDDTAED